MLKTQSKVDWTETLSLLGMYKAAEKGVKFPMVLIPNDKNEWTPREFNKETGFWEEIKF